MQQACVAASGTSSLLFTDEVTADRRSNVNDEVHRALLSAHMQPNPAKHFTMQMVDEPIVLMNAGKEIK